MEQVLLLVQNNIYFLFLGIIFICLSSIQFSRDFTKKMILLHITYINVILFLIIYFYMTYNSQITSILITIFLLFILNFFTGVGIITNIINHSKKKSEIKKS
jgi:hypothetical protein